MTTMTSRRAVLAGVATIPAALAVPALAAPAKTERKLTADELRKAFQELDPQLRDLHVALVQEYVDAVNIKKDAKIIELFGKLEIAVAKARAFDKGPMKQANKLFTKLCPPRPEPWFAEMPARIARTIPRPPWPEVELPKHMSADTYVVLKKYNPKHPAIVWYDKAMKEGDAIRAEYGKHSDVAAKESRITEVEEQSSALWNKCYPLCTKIIRQPAHSVVGLQIKVQAIKLVGDDRNEYGGPLERAWLTAQRDILALRA